MFLEQPGQASAGAGGVARQHHLAAALAQRCDMVRDGFVDVGLLRPLGREVARWLDAEVDGALALGLGEGRGEVDRPLGDGGLPFVLRQIERVGLERSVAAGFARHGPLAVGIIIGDRVPPGVERGIGGAVAKQQVVLAEMIEQGRKLFLEQLQPMLHAAHPPSVGHRLVEGVAGRGGTERLAVARAEALDAFFVKQGLGRREQREAFGAVGRTLVGRVEAAKALDLVAEEVEPERHPLARREQVDQRAAHRIFAVLGDRIDPLVAERRELADQLLAVDPLAFGDAARELANLEGGQQPLGRRRCGGDQQLRSRPLRLQRVEGRQPLGHHPKRRRGAVVGQAFPGGEGQHLDLGREQRDGVGERAHCRLVGGDDDCAGAFARPVRRPREVAGKPGQEARRNSGERQRIARLQDSLKRLAHRGVRI